jgi:hypothetical protein
MRSSIWINLGSIALPDIRTPEFTLSKETHRNAYKSAELGPKSMTSNTPPPESSFTKMRLSCQDPPIPQADHNRCPGSVRPPNMTFPNCTPLAALVHLLCPTNLPRFSSNTHHRVHCHQQHNTQSTDILTANPPRTQAPSPALITGSIHQQKTNQTNGGSATGRTTSLHSSSWA